MLKDLHLALPANSSTVVGVSGAQNHESMIEMSTQNYQDVIPGDPAFATLGDGVDLSDEEVLRLFFL